MMSNNRNYWIRKSNGREEVGSQIGMLFHATKFSVGQTPRLVQNVLGDTQLTHIVQQRCGFDRFDLPVVIYPDAFCKFDSVSLNATDVTVGNLILRIDGHRKRFDGGKIEFVQLSYMFICVFKSPP